MNRTNQSIYIIYSEPLLKLKAKGRYICVVSELVQSRIDSTLQRNDSDGPTSCLSSIVARHGILTKLSSLRYIGKAEEERGETIVIPQRGRGSGHRVHFRDSWKPRTRRTSRRKTNPTGMKKFFFHCHNSASIQP